MSAKKILIIEDDTDIRNGLRELLESEGYSVELACDGREGLNYLQHSEPSAILLDLMMPVMDGYSFMSALESNKMEKKWPVILLTAAGNRNDLTQGFHQILRKPIDVDLLLKALTSIAN